MMGGYIRAIQHHLIAEFASQAFAEAVVLFIIMLSIALPIAIAFFNRTALIIGAILMGLMSLFLVSGLVYAIYMGITSIAYDNWFIHYDRFIQLLCLVLWS